MFQAFALICMLNGECAIVSDGVQITDKSLCDNFHLATLSHDLSTNPAFVRLASKSALINVGCFDVSILPPGELAAHVINTLRSGDAEQSTKTDSERDVTPRSY
jgi:hypothetical protein